MKLSICTYLASSAFGVRFARRDDGFVGKTGAGAFASVAEAALTGPGGLTTTAGAGFVSDVFAGIGGFSGVAATGVVETGFRAGLSGAFCTEIGEVLVGAGAVVTAGFKPIAACCCFICCVI
jgi:hypothetical protein